ncbi:ornithine decarboxylase, partial [Nephila pilipes]
MDSLKPSSVWGQSCDPTDVIVKSCLLPNLEMGDWLMLGNMGAYTIVCATTFNGFQKTGVKYVVSEEA